MKSGKGRAKLFPPRLKNTYEETRKGDCGGFSPRGRGRIKHMNPWRKKRGL